MDHTTIDRLWKLEEAVRQHSVDLEDQGGTLDHLVNTVDSIVLPTLKAHGETIAAHAVATTEAHDYIMSQRGAWSLIQKGGIVIAALTATGTFVMKVVESLHALPK
jgi:hypothetical protein